MIVLGLDLASQSGWALGEPGGSPSSGTWKFEGNHQQRHAACFKAVRDLIKQHQVSHVFVERAFMRPGRDSYERVKLLTGFVIAAEIVGSRLRVPVETIQPAQIDKAVFGSSMRSKDRKAALMGWAEKLGTPDSQDAADAMAVWAAGCAQVAPEASIATLGMFGTARVK